MPFEQMPSGATLITGDSILDYRLMVMRSALMLEIQGIRSRRGRTAYAIAKSEFGFRGNKQRVLAQLEEHMRSKGLLTREDPS